jgi:hypothetical protein
MLDAMTATGDAMQVRHGSMMCIKCMMAVDTGAACAMVNRIFPVLMQGMRDRDDDVRAAAVQACVPLADTLVERAPDMVSDLISCLWELLPSFDEVSPAPASVLHLLGILSAHCLGISSKLDSPEELPDKEEQKLVTAESDETLFRNSNEEGASDTPPQSLNESLGVSIKTESAGIAEHCGFYTHTHSQASSDRERYVLTFTERLPLLWPFFNHNSTQVRAACIACCIRIMRGILSQPDAASCCTCHLRTALRLAYQVLVSAADSELLSNSEELLLLILKRTPKVTLAQVLDASTLYALMDLPCTPLGAAFPVVRLLRFPPCGAEAMHDHNGSTDRLGEAGTFQFGDQHWGDGENAATARRIACARVVGLAASATAVADKATETNMDILLTAENFCNLIATYLYSNVALQRSFGSLVILSWMQLQDASGACSAVTVPESLNTPVRAVHVFYCVRVCW